MCKLNETQSSGLRAVLGKYAFPGGYQVIATMSDGSMLCPDCVRDHLRIIAESTAGNFRDGWTFSGADVYWEGPSMFCDHCGRELPSEYGDPEEMNTECAA